MTMRRLSLLLLTVSAILSASGRAAPAEVQVGGKPEAVHLEARDASLHDVLAALHDRFNLRYRSIDALETQTTGVFDGPLSRVAARILDGYDYAMRITSDGVDVLVLSVDWFIGMARALGNLIGNCVATVVVAAWEGDLDRAKAAQVLDGGETVDVTAG